MIKRMKSAPEVFLKSNIYKVVVIIFSYFIGKFSLLPVLVYSNLQNLVMDSQSLPSYLSLERQ